MLVSRRCELILWLSVFAVSKTLAGLCTIECLYFFLKTLAEQVNFLYFFSGACSLVGHFVAARIACPTFLLPWGWGTFCFFCLLFVIPAATAHTSCLHAVIVEGRLLVSVCQHLSSLEPQGKINPPRSAAAPTLESPAGAGGTGEVARTAIRAPGLAKPAVEDAVGKVSSSGAEGQPQQRQHNVTAAGEAAPTSSSGAEWQQQQQQQHENGTLEGGAAAARISSSVGHERYGPHAFDDLLWCVCFAILVTHFVALQISAFLTFCPAFIGW